MSAQHTPGPWECVPSTEHHGPYVVSEFGSTIADCYTMTKPDLPSTANGGPSRPVHFMADMADANARLLAAAPDHALIGWAMCVQDATWEEWDTGVGEFCFAGLRHATRLDEFGCPILTVNLRAVLTEARGQ